MQAFLEISANFYNIITDNMNLCQCTGPASQIPILVTAPPIKKTNLRERFCTVTKL